LLTAVIGLVDFTTLRVVEVGCETLFVVGRAIVRTGADWTTVFFFCSAVRLIVPLASFDAGAVCANEQLASGPSWLYPAFAFVPD
jgi:hypothetical protein